MLSDHNLRFPLFSFSLSVDEPRRRRPRDRRPPRAISRPGKLSHLVQEEDQATGIHIIFTDLSTRLRERLVKESLGFAAVFCGNRWVGPLVIWSESCHSRFGPKGPDLEREIVFEERQKRTNDCLKSDPYSKVCSSGFFGRGKDSILRNKSWKLYLIWRISSLRALKPFRCVVWAQNGKIIRE